MPLRSQLFDYQIYEGNLSELENGWSKLELCPVEVSVADGFCERMGKDTDIDTTESSDGLGTKITVVLTGKMRKVFIIRRIIQMTV